MASYLFTSCVSGTESDDRDGCSDEASEIDAAVTPDDLESSSDFLGSGSFGLVFKAKWSGQIVAVKCIHTEEARAALKSEIDILSTVKHENIVQLKGYAPNHSILVMEYAEGGNLYDVLHNSDVSYSIHHALSWSHQTAKGISYLHQLHLVHRDIKPPNLLLQDHCRRIKICDFGTACSARTHMTTNKGSAMWMAPEVFISSNYTEKCDVYSWAVTFWEILARQKPVNSRSIHPFQLLWLVAHSGFRPSLFNSCPQFIEDLIVKCWTQHPNDRPSMFQVEKLMSNVVRFFNPSELDCIELPSEIDRVANEDASSSNQSQQKYYIPELYQSTSSTGSHSLQYSQVIPFHTDTPSPHDLQNDEIERPFYRQTSHMLSPVNSLLNYSFADRSGSSINGRILGSGYYLDQSLRPLKPDRRDTRSVSVYKQHCSQLAKYMALSMEQELLNHRREELMKMKERTIPYYERERGMVESDISSLSQYREDLMKQIERLELKRKAQKALKDGWVLL